jgi:hypothetical protein
MTAPSTSPSAARRAPSPPTKSAEQLAGGAPGVLWRPWAEAAEHSGASNRNSGKVEQLEEAAGQGGNLQYGGHGGNKLVTMPYDIDHAMFGWDPGAGTEVNFIMINEDARYGGAYIHINFDENEQGGKLGEPGEVRLPTLYRHTPLLRTLLCAPPPGPVEVLTDHADQGGGAGGMAPPYVKAESPKLGYKD